MADQLATANTEPACPTCGGRRLVPRLYDSGRRHTRGARIRAATLVPCPTCNAPQQLDTGEADE